MRKKLLICLCTFTLAIGLTSCGSKSDDTIAGRSTEEYKTEITTMMSQVVSLDEAGIDYNISYISGYEDGAVLVGLLEDYKECLSKDLGEFVQVKDFSVEKSGKTITSTLIGDFSNRDLKMTFVYSTLDPEKPTAMNVEPVYTLGETMQKAALNTVMGILIVFFMLVIMSGVIKCFEIIPKLQNKAKEKKEAPATSAAVTPVATKADVNNKTDDLQLVAVIAAAIAASTGASTDSFVVRSIKKRH